MLRAPETELTGQRDETNVKRVLKWIVALAVLVWAGAAPAQLDSTLVQARQLMERNDPAAPRCAAEPEECAEAHRDNASGGEFVADRLRDEWKQFLHHGRTYFQLG